MNIIITSIGRRVQLIEHFRETFTVIGVDASSQNAARYFVDRFFVIPRCDEESYISELLRIAIENDVKLILPLYEKEFEILCDNRSLFEEKGIKILLSDREVIDICNNKLATQGFFEKEGILAPRITEHAPAVIKPVDGMGSKDVFIVDNDAELEAAKILSRNDYIIQERIKGTEYTIDVLCDFEGNVVAAVPRIRLEVRSGEVAKSRTICDRSVIDKTIELIAKLNKYGKVIGPITVQCFVTEEYGTEKKEIVFLEINPRVGGGVPLTFESGINYGRYIEKFANGYVHSGEICEFKEVSMMRYDMAVYQ
ncbi:MAG: ATP-grasp domain-containing protein [Lachnospiraceae bacterium]|nr:ATP-grasp domain-containing protein [Lachnospiraceae bacterium]